MAHLTVVATLKAKPGCEDRLLPMLEALIAPTRAEPGCVQYELHRSADEPGTFLFNELWETRPLWDAHMKAPHLVSFSEKQGELTESWALFVGHKQD